MSQCHDHDIVCSVVRSSDDIVNTDQLVCHDHLPGRRGARAQVSQPPRYWPFQTAPFPAAGASAARGANRESVRSLPIQLEHHDIVLVLQKAAEVFNEDASHIFWKGYPAHVGRNRHSLPYTAWLDGNMQAYEIHKTPGLLTGCSHSKEDGARGSTAHTSSTACEIHCCSRALMISSSSRRSPLPTLIKMGPGPPLSLVHDARASPPSRPSEAVLLRSREARRVCECMARVVSCGATFRLFGGRKDRDDVITFS